MASAPRQAHLVVRCDCFCADGRLRQVSDLHMGSGRSGAPGQAHSADTAPPPDGQGKPAAGPGGSQFHFVLSGAQGARLGLRVRLVQPDRCAESRCELDAGANPPGGTRNRMGGSRPAGRPPAARVRPCGCGGDHCRNPVRPNHSRPLCRPIWRRRKTLESRREAFAQSQVAEREEALARAEEEAEQRAHLARRFRRAAAAAVMIGGLLMAAASFLGFASVEQSLEAAGLRSTLFAAGAANAGRR